MKRIFVIIFFLLFAQYSHASTLEEMRRKAEQRRRPQPVNTALGQNEILQIHSLRLKRDYASNASGGENGFHRIDAAAFNWVLELKFSINKTGMHPGLTILSCLYDKHKNLIHHSEQFSVPEDMIRRNIYELIEIQTDNPETDPEQTNLINPSDRSLQDMNRGAAQGYFKGNKKITLYVHFSGIATTPKFAKVMLRLQDQPPVFATDPSNADPEAFSMPELKPDSDS